MKKEKVSDRGPSGLAEVRVLKDRYKVIFRSIYDEDTKTMEDVSVTYEIKKEGTEVPVVQDKNLRVSLSPDKTSIYSCRPWSETHPAVFSRFVSGEDGVPTVREVDAKQIVIKKGPKAGAKFPGKAHQEFTAIFSIIAGPCSGLEITQNFWYVFRRDTDGSTKLMGPGFAVDRLDDFFRIGGLTQEDVLPYSDNVLSELEKVLRDRNKPFMLEVNEGWVRAMSSPGVGVTIDTPKRSKAKPVKAAPVEVEVDEDEDE